MVDYHDLSLLLLAAAWLFFSAFISLVRIFLSWPPGLGRFVFSSASRLLRCLPEHQTINNLNIRYLHTKHTLTPATYQQPRTNDIQENVLLRSFKLSTLSLCKLLTHSDTRQVLPLTSDAHVDVLVLVEVVVLELVHVVLGHAGVVMQLELE